MTKIRSAHLLFENQIKTLFLYLNINLHTKIMEGYIIVRVVDSVVTAKNGHVYELYKKAQDYCDRINDVFNKNITNSS